MNTTEVGALQRMTESAIHEEMDAARRRGNSGPWCYACGHTVPDLAACGCQFPQSFHCAGEKLCSECRDAHRAVAKHLTGMFSHPPVRRVDALRARKFRFLRNALAAIAEKYRDKSAAALKRELSTLDSYLDPRDEFRRDALAIFSESRFFRWLELAEELRSAEHDFYLESVITSGIFGR